MASLGLNWYLSWWLRTPFLRVATGVNGDQVHSIWPPFVAVTVYTNFHTTRLSSLMCLRYQPWWWLGPALLTLWHASITRRDAERRVWFHRQVWRGTKGSRTSSKCSAPADPGTTARQQWFRTNPNFYASIVPKGKTESVADIYLLSSILQINSESPILIILSSRKEILWRKIFRLLS